MTTDDEITVDDVKKHLPNLMAGVILNQATRITALTRELGALRAAMMPDQKEMAEAILRSMDEEAANLRPMFNEHERSVLREALAAFQPAEQDYEGRQTVADIIEKLDMMHATESRRRV